MKEDNRIEIRVSNNLKRMRDMFSLTQKDIAKTIGIGRATVSKVESKNQDFKLTKPNMLLTAFIFKNELEKIKKKIADIKFVEEESDYNIVIKKLKNASITEEDIKVFLEKFGNQLIKKKDKEKIEMKILIWFYILTGLFKNPNKADFPNNQLTKEKFKQIIDGLIHYYEFTLEYVYFNTNKKFEIHKGYNFDPYELINREEV